MHVRANEACRFPKNASGDYLNYVGVFLPTLAIRLEATVTL